METSTYWSVHYFSDFHWSPSVGKPRMTPVYFVNITESYEVPLGTISRQTSYDSVIFSQDFGDTSKQWNHTKFADWVTIWLVHLPERTEASLITASDQNNRSEQTVRGLHSCNSWSDTFSNMSLSCEYSRACCRGIFLYFQNRKYKTKINELQNQKSKWHVR